jgi:L-ascorbate metabolism protein UlaG (beta-lactamase superfamily)
MKSELTFIGTATTLLSLGPFKVLTDPNFLHRGERAYLGYGITSKRLSEPALQPDQLPTLDAVVLSHVHGDHWDRRARGGLDPALPIITTTAGARALRRWPNKRTATVGLVTWQTHHLDQDGWTLTITAVPGQHAFGALRLLLPPVMGSVIELTSPAAEIVKRVYLTGDTLVFDGLRQIAARFPAIDTAVVHLGGTTLPGGFVVTMTGSTGADLCEMIKPAAVVPVHYDDYAAFKDPLVNFRTAMSERNLPLDLRLVARGETVTL